MHPLLPRSTGPWLLLTACLVGLAARTAWTEDPPAAPPVKGPPAAGGPVYKNAAAGVTVTGPQGWTLKSSGAEAASWKQLAVFSEPNSLVEVTLSQRDRTTSSLAALQTQVQKEWEGDRSFSTSGVRAVEPTPLRPVGMVQVEATQVRKAQVPAGAAPGTPAPQPVLWNLLVSYVVTQRHEILVYATGPAVAWPGARGSVQALLDSITLSSPPRGPEGEGAYRNDERGFGVRYPKGSTVVVPPRRDHVVSFVPTAADLPVLDVFVLEWKDDLAKDAERLVKHFQDVRGGQASSRIAEVGGLPGMLVTANLVEQGRESTVLVALVQRGEELFRLRGSMPETAAAAGQKTFDEFVGSFAFTAAK